MLNYMTAQYMYSSVANVQGVYFLYGLEYMYV